MGMRDIWEVYSKLACVHAYKKAWAHSRRLFFISSPTDIWIASSPAVVDEAENSMFERKK